VRLAGINPKKPADFGDLWPELWQYNCQITRTLLRDCYKESLICDEFIDFMFIWVGETMYDYAASFEDKTTLSVASDISSDKTTGLYARFGKRLFDILFVIAIAPLLLPVIAVLALMIRRDGGSAFYSQPRIGRNGETFRFYKLRSMVVDGDARLARYLEENPDQREIWTRTQKLENDPRVTPFGNFLRKSSLDELPQFLNVLLGDMSVVGPRPFLPDQEARYRAAGGQAYFALRPGVTGLWQVGTRNKSSFEGRVKFDEAYKASFTFGMDLRVIFATFGVMASSTGV
jgi:exopolysaccharide production protein ExoY